MEMEAGGPSSKRRRSVSPGENEDGGGADLLSALPDSVLGDVISLLPTKDGARTRVLASRWCHLWRSAPLNLECHGLVSRWDKRDQLAGVVSHILSSHQGPGRSFCFPYLPEGEESGYGAVTTVDSWLRFSALDNLQEMHVWYGRHHPFSESTFRFSTTLRVLTIRGCDPTVQALHFPLLKQLGIEYVKISECSLHNLIASCPVLECLFIRYTIGFSCIRINSSSIKRVGIRGYGSDEPDSTEEMELKELIIESAPCLEMLLDLCNDGLHASVVSAPKLETLGFRSKNLSNDMDLSTRLVFGSTVIKGLRVDSMEMVVHTVKILAVHMITLDLDIVIDLLRCFPCLEKLYIKCCAARKKNLWRRKHRKLIRCLDIRLKTIVISSYQGFWYQVNFATFFVLKAKVLELMIFVVSSTTEEFIAKQQKKLQLDNRASRGAQFQFTTDSCLRGGGRLEINHVCDLDLANPFICRC